MEAKRKVSRKMSDEREIKNVDIWLQALEDETEKMNEWEQGFYTSVSDWFYNDHPLSPKQYETLERLYRRFY